MRQKNFRSFWHGASGLFLALMVACSPAPKSTSSSSNEASETQVKQEVIGVYSVTVGDGVEQAVVQDNSPVTQGLQITSYNGGGILDIGEDRYINYGYKVTNQTGRTLSNLTFLAVNKSTFGTDAATYNIKNASGNVIPSAAPYMVPVNYIATANSDRTLLTFGRNLAVYQEDEISDTVKSYATANNLTVFPYGFTMRVPVTGVPIKTLENNAAALVTFSFKMPKSLGIAKFDYGFLAITDTVTRVSQGVNEATEQNWKDTLARAKNLGADKITYFATEPKTVDSETLTTLSPYNPVDKLAQVSVLRVSKSLTHYAYSYNTQSYPTAQKASTSTQTLALGGKNTGLLGLNIPSGGLQISYLLGTGDVKLAADYTAANKPNIVFNAQNTAVAMVLTRLAFDTWAADKKLGAVDGVKGHSKLADLASLIQASSNPFGDSAILAIADEIAAAATNPASVAEKLKALEDSGEIPKLDRSDSLTGPDTNSNGVRDDVEAYIAKNYPEPQQQKAAMQFAGILQERFNFSVDDKEAARINALKSMSAIYCLKILREVNNTNVGDLIIDDLISITYNTKERSKMYMRYSDLLDGTALRFPGGNSCE